MFVEVRLPDRHSYGVSFSIDPPGGMRLELSDDRPNRRRPWTSTFSLFSPRTGNAMRCPARYAVTDRWIVRVDQQYPVKMVWHHNGRIEPHVLSDLGRLHPIVADNLSQGVQYRLGVNDTSQQIRHFVSAYRDEIGAGQPIIVIRKTKIASALRSLFRSLTVPFGVGNASRCRYGRLHRTEVIVRPPLDTSQPPAPCARQQLQCAPWAQAATCACTLRHRCRR